MRKLGSVQWLAHQGILMEGAVTADKPQEFFAEVFIVGGLYMSSQTEEFLTGMVNKIFLTTVLRCNQYK